MAASHSNLNTIAGKLSAAGVTVTGGSESTSGATPVSLFGGYRVNRYFSAQFGYTHFGTLWVHCTFDTSGGPLNVHVTEEPQAFALTALGALSLSRGWGLFAPAGLAHYWGTQAPVMTFGGTSHAAPTTSDSGLTGVDGLGASYRFGWVMWRVGVTLYPSTKDGDGRRASIFTRNPTRATHSTIRGSPAGRVLNPSSRPG